MMTAGGVFVFTLVFVFLLSEGEVGVEEVVMMKAVQSFITSTGGPCHPGHVWLHSILNLGEATVTQIMYYISFVPVLSIFTTVTQ